MEVDGSDEAVQYMEAVTWYEKALEVLLRLENEKRLRPVNQKWIPILSESIAKCRKAMAK